MTAVAARPDPAVAVPWGVRVAAEAGWRLLVLAGTLWVLMRVISAVQLVVFAFVAALLITAILQPAVARLKQYGVPRGLATALTAILGFVVIGLIGWFVVWQVQENIDNLSDQIQDGVDELRNWLLNSPFHVTDKQINEIAKNLRDAIGTNTDQITSAGLEGVTVIVEALTGILLTMFSTLFLLYDGKQIWEWTLRLVPAAARPGVAGAGPRAWRTLTAYVRGTVVVALIDAIFIGLGIYFLDVPMAVPLAVFIFLGAFIPLVGAVMSGALAVVVALVTQGALHRGHGARRGARRAADRGSHPAAVHSRAGRTGPSAGGRPVGRRGWPGRRDRRGGGGRAAGGRHQHGGGLSAVVRLRGARGCHGGGSGTGAAAGAVGVSGALFFAPSAPARPVSGGSAPRPPCRAGRARPQTPDGLKRAGD